MKGIETVIFGDPTFVGWITVGAYLVTAVLCWKVARNILKANPANSLSKMAFFWFFLTALMLILAVNKQLDAQSWLTNAIRLLARKQGWYGHRRTVQEWFIATIAILSLLGLITILWLIWRAPRRPFFALLGMGILLCYVLFRAASFHHVDDMLGWRIGMWKLRWIMELSGIFCISISSSRFLYTKSAG